MEANQILDLLYTSDAEVVETEAVLKSVTEWETRDDEGNLIIPTEDKKRYRIAFMVGDARKTAFVFKNAFPESTIPRFDREGLPVTITLSATPVEYTKRNGEAAQGARVLSINYSISDLPRNAVALMSGKFML